MIRCCVPDVFQQFDPAELLQLHAAPVGRRTTRFKPRRAVATVLITENARLAGVVAPQPMRAHQARESIIGHAFLGDGRLLVVGGHNEDEDGLSQAALYDWATNTWTPTARMTG